MPFASNWLNRKLWCLICLAFLAVSPLWAQTKTSTDWAWKPVLEADGVFVHYLFYSETDEGNDGVVLKIVNTRKESLRYSFTIILKSTNAEFEKAVLGEIEAETILTGESAGLYWAPFQHGDSIGEIGLRGFKVVKIRT